MKVSVFQDLVKGALPGDYVHLYKVNVVTNLDHTNMRIYRTSHCKHCNHDNTESVVVVFNEPERLSIFQAGLLFCLFRLNRRPVDYASYHKSPAGKRFIENIVSVEVME